MGNKNSGKPSKRPLHTYITNSIITIAVMILFWGIARIFAVAFYKIPSASMRPTLLNGDHIVVNKLAYGARLFDFSGNIKEGGITRLRGCSEMKRNDIMVFNFPYNNGWDTICFDISNIYVKRCVGLPGDTIEIRNGHYHIIGLNASLGNIEAQDLIESITNKTDSLTKQNPAYWTAPYNHPKYRWNIREYGPLYIPKRGDVISLDTINAAFYQKLIEWETNKNITNKGNLFYAGDSLLGPHTMRNGYLFMAGDNCIDSRDSRYWGLVPETFVIGRVSFIWKSIDPTLNKYRWERTFTIVE